MKVLASALALLLASCRPVPPAEDSKVFAPPPGRRAFAIAVDKSQARFLAAGDAVEAALTISRPRRDGSEETSAEILSRRAEVLAVVDDWADGTGLVLLALTPEEIQYAALAVDREDRVFLSKLGEAPAALVEKPAPGPAPALEAGHRGLAVLVHPDQQEFLDPGDRVDLVATRQAGRASGKSELVAVTLLQDVLVLKSSPAEGNEEWASVQLMLAADQVKTLTKAIAAEDQLTLAVRAPGDRTTKPVEPARMSRKFSAEAERASTKS